MSPSARHHFVRGDWNGKMLADLLPDHLRSIAVRSSTEVAATSVADSFQLRTGPNADRRLDVTIQPFGDGVCIVGHDRSGVDERRDVVALSSAVRETLQILGSVAVARINLRDFIVRASESFETMSDWHRTHTAASGCQRCSMSARASRSATRWNSRSIRSGRNSSPHGGSSTTPRRATSGWHSRPK